jgi:hypothetical protein
MRLRPRRRNLVVWSSSADPAGRAWRRSGARPGRIRRLRWWLRTGMLVTVIGVLWLARTARTRWEPLALLAGVLLMALGYLTPAIGAFFPGMLVLVVTLLRGTSQAQRRGPVR